MQAIKSNSMHWLERLKVNLDNMPERARNTAYSLLNSPWLCNRVDIATHVPEPLSRAILDMQQSVKRHVFCERRRISIGSAIRLASYDVLFHKSDGSEISIKNAAFINVENLVAIIKEDLDKAGRDWKNLSGQAQASLLSLYAICESAVYVMAKMFEKEEAKGNTLQYSIAAKDNDAYKILWFSRYWAKQSNISDALSAQRVGRILQNSPSPARKHNLFIEWVDTVLDKYLCLHPNYIHKLLATKNGVALKKLRNRAELISFLCIQAQTQDIDQDKFLSTVFSDLPFATISYEKLHSAGFSLDEVQKILSDSLALEPSDRLLIPSHEAGVLNISALRLKFALQTYLKPELTILGSELGTWFEKNYILEYIDDRIDKKRFKASTDIKDADAHYDADIVIYDKLSDIFYFCQVKHRADVLQPFLRDELKEYVRNSSFQKGINQLKALRSSIDTPGVRERVVGRMGKKLVGDAPLGPRSRFLLIHNVENFDMCTVDGIAMHEWNSFRNYLQGRIFYARDDVTGTSHYETNFLDFANIPHLQSHLMRSTERLFNSNEAKQPGPAQMYEILKGAQILMVSRNSLWVNDWQIFPMGSTAVRFPLL